MDITLSEDIDPEYLEDVSDILTNREFLALNCFKHHYATTRLMHSMNVSYISWLLAKKLGCDAKAAARAGLLHDFFLYDPKQGRPSRELQAFCHPKVAAANSKAISPKKKKKPYCLTCFLWALFPKPRKPGSLPVRISSVPVWRFSISASH